MKKINGCALPKNFEINFYFLLKYLIKNILKKTARKIVFKKCSVIGDFDYVK